MADSSNNQKVSNFTQLPKQLMQQQVSSDNKKKNSQKKRSFVHVGEIVQKIKPQYIVLLFVFVGAAAGLWMFINTYLYGTKAGTNDINIEIASATTSGDRITLGIQLSNTNSDTQDGISGADLCIEYEGDKVSYTTGQTSYTPSGYFDDLVVESTSDSTCANGVRITTVAKEQSSELQSSVLVNVVFEKLSSTGSTTFTINSSAQVSGELDQHVFNTVLVDGGRRTVNLATTEPTATVGPSPTITPTRTPVVTCRSEQRIWWFRTCPIRSGNAIFQSPANPDEENVTDTACNGWQSVAFDRSVIGYGAFEGTLDDGSNALQSIVYEEEDVADYRRVLIDDTQGPRWDLLTPEDWEEIDYTSRPIRSYGAMKYTIGGEERFLQTLISKDGTQGYRRTCNTLADTGEDTVSLRDCTNWDTIDFGSASDDVSPGQSTYSGYAILGYETAIDSQTYKFVETYIDDAGEEAWIRSCDVTQNTAPDLSNASCAWSEPVPVTGIDLPNGSNRLLDQGIFPYEANGQQYFYQSILTDELACGDDTDQDGINDDEDIDDDNDGITDDEEGGDDDNDNDGIPNRIDIDSDNDGITDLIEAQESPVKPYESQLILPVCSDADNDGLLDPFDDPFPDTGLIPVNSDDTYDRRDDVPDFLDLDSDGDGPDDPIEGHDENIDGIPDNAPATPPSDNDIDGLYGGYDTGELPDPYTCEDWASNHLDTNAVLQNTDQNINNNPDDLEDWRDPNDEGDERDTWDEDRNNNGDWSDDDADNDGIPDYLDIDNGDDGTPTPTPDDLTPTPTGGATVTVNIQSLKVKYQGVIPVGGREPSEQPLLTTVALGNNDLSYYQETDINFNAIGTEPDQAGNNVWLWEGRDITFTGVDITEQHIIFVKGPKQLQKAICEPNPTEGTDGTYQCNNANITLTEDNNTFDFTDIYVLGGDLPFGGNTNPGGGGLGVIGAQDGVVDSIDLTYIRAALNLTREERKQQSVIRIGDVGLDAINDTQDHQVAAFANKNQRIDDRFRLE